MAKPTPAEYSPLKERQMRRRILTVLLSAMSVALFVPAMVGTASATTSTPAVVYDSTVSPLPPSLPSEGPEAYSFAQMGNEVTLAGTNRVLNSATVTLTDWACQYGM
jgi:ABC-type oligopeptide transport system substrate-binding subunit